MLVIHYRKLRRSVKRTRLITSDVITESNGQEGNERIVNGV